MASRDWSTFKFEEKQLAQLRRKAKRLKIGLAVFAGMTVAFVAAALILVLCFAQPWASLLFVPAIVCFLGFAHCILSGRNEVWPEVDAVTEAQKFYYAVLKRQEWRDRTRRTATPNWKVEDRWVGDKHYYSLVDLDEPATAQNWENLTE